MSVAGVRVVEFGTKPADGGVLCGTCYLEQTEDDPLLDIDGVRLTDSALPDGDIMSRDILTGGDAALLDAADDVIALTESCRCKCCMLDLPYMMC